MELGHAERRQYFNENDVCISWKVRTALRHNLRPVVCVGESAEDRDFGVENETVTRQVRIAITNVEPRNAQNLIIAYEPVWAIGEEGTMASLDNVREMSRHIRCVLESDLGTEAASRVHIIYGGDVNEHNAPQILRHSGVQGLFIGRAALQVENFVDLIKACLQVGPEHRPANARGASKRIPRRLDRLRRLAAHAGSCRNLHKGSSCPVFAGIVAYKLVIEPSGRK